MNISSATQSSTSISPQSGANSQVQSVYQSQAAYQTRQSSITMKTAEGDVVSISGFAATGSLTELDGWHKGRAGGASFTEATMQSSSLQISVKGDLNEQELQDINNLLDDLQQLSSTFFSGDTAQAMQQALTLGDMGSITQLQASFQYNAGFAGQYANYHHPVPTSFSDQVQSLQQDLTGLADQLGEPLDQLLQAQWDQIEAFLNQQKGDNGQVLPQQPAADEEGQAQPSAQTADPPDIRLASYLDAMKKRIETTIADHPRLSPHTLPVARKALQQAQAAGHTDNGHHYGKMLHGPIMHHLKNWLLAA